MQSSRSYLPSYVVVTGLILLLAYPALVWLVRSWLSNPYYSHGFIVPLIAAFIAWRQWRRVSAAPRAGGFWYGLLLAVASLGVITWAMLWNNYYLAVLALVLLLVGIVLLLEGWSRLRHWLFPLLFLALMVPLPFIDLASPLFESFTASTATALARLGGISAVQQGSEISVPGTLLVVGAPCSGLRSLVAMITVAVAWVYFVEGRPGAKLLMIAAIVPLVAMSNVLRITILLVVAATLGEETALGYYHDWSSPLLFIMALGLLLLLGKALGCSRIRDGIF